MSTPRASIRTVPRRDDVVVAALGIVAMSLLLVYAATIGVHVQRHNDFYKEVWPPTPPGAGRRPPWSVSICTGSGANVGSALVARGPSR